MVRTFEAILLLTTFPLTKMPRRVPSRRRTLAPLIPSPPRLPQLPAAAPVLEILDMTVTLRTDFVNLLKIPTITLTGPFTEEARFRRELDLPGIIPLEIVRKFYVFVESVSLS